MRLKYANCNGQPAEGVRRRPLFTHCLVKAFARFPHVPILLRLQSYGFVDAAPEIPSIFLTSQIFTVKVIHASSQLAPVIDGVR